MDQLLYFAVRYVNLFGIYVSGSSPPAGTALSRLALEQCDICAKVKGKGKLSRAVAAPLKEI